MVRWANHSRAEKHRATTRCHGAQEQAVLRCSLARLAYEFCAQAEVSQCAPYVETGPLFAQRTARWLVVGSWCRDVVNSVSLGTPSVGHASAVLAVELLHEVTLNSAFEACGPELRMADEFCISLIGSWLSCLYFATFPPFPFASSE